MNIKSIFRLSVLVLFLFPISSNAQYFGQNKPRYKSFEFDVTNSPNFAFYTYTKNGKVKDDLIQWTEQWYRLHQRILRDTFTDLNPIIFYNNHAEFQQTNSISGHVGVGTGGVTEGLKNRVVMPFTMLKQQTNRVLGHELVHAFQYHMIINGDSTSLKSLANIPLWMIEGMAEYLSLGRIDAHTSMWMRDAVMNDDVPTIKQLSDPKYFPYRYGQAFWAFFSGVYGDKNIKPFFEATAIHGLENATELILNVDVKTLSGMFQESLRTHFRKFLNGEKENLVGTKIITEKNAGRLNISPVVSPNGKHVLFFSDRNLFSTDLYLADARTGKNIRKMNNLLKDGGLDDFSYLESAGTWSPDSKKFAFVAFKQGQNVIVVKDVEHGKTIETIKLDKVKALANPTWSPRGNKLVFSGMVEGQTDLYVYQMKSKKLSRLTDDLYSEVHANWNKEGTKVAFSTDRLSVDRGRVNGRWTLNIAELDIETRAVTNHEIFIGADNTNPNYDSNGNLYFLSDRDGFKNVYHYKIESDSLFQSTDFKTGVSGVGRYSPALSVSKSRDRIAYSHFYKGQYDIFQARSSRLLKTPVDRTDVDMAAGTLPVIGLSTDQSVMLNISSLVDTSSLSKSDVRPGKYASKFKLDYISGQAGAGVGTGSFGSRSALAGGVQLLFSDILGDHQLISTVALNGELIDFGVGLQYLNRKKRLTWGFGFSHVPLRTGFYNQFIDTSTYTRDLLVVEENTIRIFEDQLSGIVQYPISKNLRLEGSLATNRRSYRYDKKDLLFDPLSGIFVGEGEKEKAPVAEIERLLGIRSGEKLYYNASAAIVGDDSSFGATAPLNGYRYRFDVNRYFGLYNFTSATADVRLYQRLKPITLAFRATHFSRFGRDANSFRPILIGDAGLVRGFNFQGIQDIRNQTGIGFTQFSGSKVIATGVEVRLPFSGPKELAVVKSKFLLTDLNLFVDAGIAFNEYDQIGKAGTDIRSQRWAVSTGASMRVNLFGALIIEPYYAIPIMKGVKGGTLGVNFVPGW